MHANAEMYHEIYRDNPDYLMKVWRQKNLRQYLDGWAGRTMLDVGCGRGESIDIAREMGVNARGCEIAECLVNGDVDMLTEGAKKLPYADDEFHIVTNLDVMEHIPEEEVDDSLREMWRVARQRLMLGICCKPGPNKVLHCTQHPPKWWIARIGQALNGIEAITVLDYMEIPKVKQPYLYVEVA